MAYNETLANRIREAFSDLPTVEEKKMFGGLAFMIDDKMCITVGKDIIMCRINPSIHDEITKTKNCNTVKMRGHEYKGYVQVNEDDLKSKRDLDYWINLALDYNKIAKATKKK